MLKKKLILIVSIILLFSLCLVNVSATDSSLINSTDSHNGNLQSSNLDINNNSNIAGDYNTKLNSEDGSQIILDDNGNDGSFSDLQKLIDSNTNGTIDLDKDYKYTENDNLPDGITINGKTLIINGNGHTLDGSNLARIFNISDSLFIPFISFKSFNSKLESLILNILARFDPSNVCPLPLIIKVLPLIVIPSGRLSFSVYL